MKPASGVPGQRRFSSSLGSGGEGVWIQLGAAKEGFLLLVSVSTSSSKGYMRSLGLLVALDRDLKGMRTQKRGFLRAQSALLDTQ